MCREPRPASIRQIHFAPIFTRPHPSSRTLHQLLDGHIADIVRVALFTGFHQFAFTRHERHFRYDDNFYLVHWKIPPGSEARANQYSWRWGLPELLDDFQGRI